MRAWWVLVAAGCGRIGFDAQSADARPGWGPFGAPELIGATSSASREFGVSVSADELELYFSSNRSGSFRIWRTSRTSADVDFDPPMFALFGGMQRGGEPTLARNGLEMFVDDSLGVRATTADTAWSDLSPEVTFASYQGQDFGGHDLRMVMHLAGELYEATRVAIGAPWSTPVRIPGIQLFPTQNFAAMTDDGLELFIQADLGQRNKILYTSRPSLDEPFAVPIVAVEFADAGCGDPAVSADGSALYFSSDVADPGMPDEIYVIRRERL